MRRKLGVVLATAVATVGLGQLPALADDTVTVHGTAFPHPRAASLTLVGCESLYQRGTEFLQPYISRGPGRPALGTRSLKYDLAGGNAIGTLSYVDSMAGTTAAGLQVYARSGAQGVAYAGYQSPDADGNELWVGRASLSASGSWQQVDATALSYTWAEFDMQTGVPTGETAETATVAGFAAGHGGDGAGFYMVGFGCDGAPFYMDGWRVGAPGATTTYDLEALTSHLTMSGSARSIDPGDEVTINGSVRDGTGKRLARGTMILEAKPVGTASFLPVQVVDAASTDPSVTVAPTGSTIYRWRFADRPLATGSVSRAFRVDVRQPRRETEPQTPQQTPQATPTPHAPRPSPTSPRSNPPATSETPADPTTPSETPSPEATLEPSTTPSPTS
ncbi:MAG TPA: hypothetical protein VNQ53_16315 [Nocardioides sp.]|nr:hypothetical protein [Nocardioides sp.]